MALQKGKVQGYLGGGCVDSAALNPEENTGQLPSKPGFLGL